MAPKLVKWCMHPVRHKDCIKVGQTITHPKGQCLIRERLAKYMCNRYHREIKKTKNIIKETDYLCTNCYNIEYNHMIKKYGVTKRLTDEENLFNDDQINENYGDTMLSSKENEKSLEEAMEEQLNMSISDMSDYEQSQGDSLRVLNEVFRLLKIEPITDVRHTEKARNKVHDAYIALNNLYENVSKSKSTTIINNDNRTSLDVRVEDCQTILNGIKQLFFLSKKELQLQLLTTVPSEWGRKKIEYYFGCTEHQAKQAILLRDKFGILARPFFFSGNKPIENSVIEQVMDFYENDKISRQSSNKKDTIKVKDEEKIFRFMEISIRDAYVIFKAENPNTQIGISKFYSLRPKWVKINAPHYTCLCIYHENWYLLVEAWNKKFKTKWDLPQLTNFLICQFSTEKCYLRSCDNCSNKFPSSILRQTHSGDPNHNIDDDDEIVWFNWMRVSNKIHLQEINGNISMLCDTIDEQWSTILSHDYVKTQQKSFIDDLKKNSSENTYVVVTVDFAENYTIVAQREVQSAHWNQQQVSIFTIHFKVGLKHHNLAAISNYLNHDTAFVYYCQQHITNFIKNLYPNIQKIIYVSDGAPMHFKNKYNLSNLTFHKDDFGLIAEWLCTATSHGNSACDGNSLQPTLV